MAVEKNTITRVVVMENYYKETSDTTSSFMLSLLDFINVM